MKRKTLLFSIIILVFIFLASSVLAINGCCERTLDGEYCMQIDDSLCNVEGGYQFVPSSCESTSFCKLGCCYSSDRGRCFKNSPRAACESEPNSTFSASPDCSNPQCERGCCVLSDQAFYVTQVRCKRTTNLYPDVEMVFDENVKSERECIEQSKSLEEGCCVKDDGTCTFTTKGNCPSATTQLLAINETIEGKVGFFKDLLCSNDLLNCDCAKQQKTGCVGEDLYWFDSCGNRENIYDIDRKKSYNDGKVLKEEDSCVASGPNDPNCGNCHYPGSTVCGQDKAKVMPIGEYTCVGLGCKKVYDDAYSPNSGGDKKNGESWCIYDSQVGLGRDLVGSRFYRHVCINGEEIVEPCKDFREEICIQGVLGEEVLRNYDSFLLSDGEYTEAACRKNRWADCDSCNTLNQLPGKPTEEDLDKGEDEPEVLVELKKECCMNEDVRDCYWLEAGITDAGGVCIPQIPPGLKHWGAASTTQATANANAAATGAKTVTASTPAEQTCAKANMECKVTFKIGGWKRFAGAFKSKDDREEYTRKNAEIIRNKVCTQKKWVIAGNNYCKAQGDCGAYFNILGAATGDGYINTMVFEEDFFDGSSRALEESDYGDFETMINKPSDDKTGDWDLLKKDPGFWTMIGGFALSGFLGAIGPAGTKGNQSWYKGFGTGLFGGLSSVMSWGQKCTPKKTSKTSTTAAKKTDAKKKGTAATPPAKPTGAETQKPSTTVAAVGIDSITGAQIAGLLGGQQQQTPGVPNGYYNPGGYGLIGAVTQGAGALKDPKTLAGLAAQAAQSGGCKKGFGGKANSIYSGGSLGSLVNLAAWGALIYTSVQYGAAKEESRTYKIICRPWQAPTGSTDCEKCNDPMKPCSEYRCKSLGQNCGIVNKGTANETCISLDPNDVNSPQIEPMPEYMLPYTIREVTEEGNKGFWINEQVQAFAPVLLAIKMNEPAQCKYDFQPKVPYDNMANIFGSSQFNYNQTFRFSLPSAFTSKNATEVNKGEYTLYVKCQDGNGNKNENDRDYFIKFKVDPSPDLTPPIIRFTSLQDNSFVAFNETEVNLNIYVNEPSTCKWSRRDTGYDLMENEFECETNEYSQSAEYLATYECNTRIKNLTNVENKFYFKCKDKPEAPDDERNLNDDSYEFTLRGTKEPLRITSIGPTGDIFSKDLTMKVITAGGTEEGKAICAFSEDEVPYSEMIAFGTTDAAKSEQEITGLPKGDYKYFIECMDGGANKAEGIINFTIDVDEYPPKITSLYADAYYGTLYLTLDEESTCEYLENNKDFIFGEGTRFSGTNATALEADWDPNVISTWNVKCMDKFGNEGKYTLYV